LEATEAHHIAIAAATFSSALSPPPTGSDHGTIGSGSSGGFDAHSAFASSADDHTDSADDAAEASDPAAEASDPAAEDASVTNGTWTVPSAASSSKTESSELPWLSAVAVICADVSTKNASSNPSSAAAARS
jgi:hypothetical protein